MIPYAIIRKLATLDDARFSDWAAKVGYSLGPEESFRSFRERVVQSLSHLSDEIDRLEAHTR